MAEGVASKFFFSDGLTLNNILDWHGVILIQNPTPTLPERGGS